MRNRVFILTLAVLLLLPLAHAGAQTMASTPPPSTPPPSTPPPPPSGPSAFDQLSPGGQKIALALYQAQPRPHRRGDGTIGGSMPTRLTLDQIAQRKQDGQGWGQVFKGMKAEGLVTQKNLGQVVSSYNHNHRHHQRHHYDRDQGHHRHHGHKKHDGDRHERYARHDGHDRHEGYRHREGHRTYGRDGRGHEGRHYAGRGDEGRRYEGRSYESRGSEGRRYGGGEHGSRVGASSSRPTYTATAARSNDGGRGYQAGSSPRQGGGSGNGHSK